MEFLTKLFKPFRKIGWTDIAKGLVAGVVLIIYNVASNKETSAALTQELLNRRHNEISSSARENITPGVQKRLIDLVLTLNCDRAFVLEGHNGKENLASLPFKSYEMTFEEPNSRLHSQCVAEDYKDIQTSLYKFPQYIKNNTYFIGTVEELKQIDDKMAGKIENNNGVYIGLIAIRIDGRNVGLLGVVWDRTNPNKIADVDVIKNELLHSEEVISPQLKLMETLE